MVADDAEVRVREMSESGLGRCRDKVFDGVEVVKAQAEVKAKVVLGESRSERCHCQAEPG